MIAASVASRRSHSGTGSRAGRGRDDFDRALKAEVRDALWMLARSGRLGEFQGDDAGSPIFAKVRYARAGAFRAGGAAASDSTTTPRWRPASRRGRCRCWLGAQAISLDLRCSSAGSGLKMMAAGSATSSGEFARRYPIHAPDPTTRPTTR